MSKVFALHADPKKILIIEDDRSVAELVSLILRQRGFQTTIADDGEAGLANALFNHPDAIILDLHMPGMGGFAFLKHRPQFEDLKAIPIIVLTASRQKDDVERALLLGAVGYVAKPVQVAALLGRLEKHIPSPLFARRDTTDVSWSAPARGPGRSVAQSRHAKVV
jgi:CheY-like chemotaxis protein